jgi:CRISPR associated protein Cas1
MASAGLQSEGHSAVKARLTDVDHVAAVAGRKTEDRPRAEHQGEALTGLGSADPEPDNASLDAASDAYWVESLQVKSRVLATIYDNASLRVKGGALIVCDGENRLVYDAAARKPQAIVMTGWSGLATVEAMRWACDHKVAIILLDWMRDFLTIVGASAKPSAALIRAQVFADSLTVARAVVAAKINAHVRVGALSRQAATPFLERVANNDNAIDPVLELRGIEKSSIVGPSASFFERRLAYSKIRGSLKILNANSE